MTKVQNTNVSAATPVENKKVKKQQQKKEQQVFKGNGNKQTVQKPNDSALKQEIYKKTGFQLKDTKNRGQIINLKVNGRVRPYETVGTLTTGGRILVKEKGKEVYHVVSHTPDKKPVMLKDDYARNKVFYETTSAEHKVKIGKKNYIITNSKRDRHGRMTAINSRGQEVILSHDGKELKHSYVEAEDQKDNLNDYIAQQTKGKSKAEANKIRQQIMDGNSSYSSKGVLRFKASNGEVWYYDTKRKTYVKYAEKEAQAIIKDLDKGAKEDWWLFRTGLGTDYELLKNTNAQIIDPEVLNKINKHYSTEYGKKVDKNAEYGSGKYKTAYEAFLASEIGDDEVYLFNATLVKNKAITDQSRRNEILQTNLTKISGIGIEGIGVGVNKRANRMAAADAASTKEDYQTLQDAAEEENKKKNYKAQFKGQDALQTYIYGVHDGDVQEIDDFNNALIDPKENILDRDEIVRIKAETGVLWLKEGDFKKGFEAQDNDVTKQMFALQNPNGKAVLNANTLKQQAVKDKQEDYMMMARPDLYSDKELASRATQLLKDALLNLNNYHSIEFQSMRSQTGNYDILAQNKVDFKKDAEENISRAYSMIRNDKILAMVKKEMGNNYNLLVQREQEHLKTNNLKNITTITDTQVTKYTDNKGEVKLTPEQIAHNKYVVTWLKSQLSDIERDKKSNEAKEGWKQGFVNNTRDLLFGGVTRASLADKYNLIKSNMARLEAAAEGKLVDASGKPVSFEDAMKNLGETGIQALEQANAEYQTAQQIGEFMVDMVALALPLPKSFNAANTVIKMGNALYKVISKSDKVCKVVKITQEAAKGSKIYEVTAKVATKNPKLVENTRKVATIMDSSATGAMHMAGKTLVLDATNIATSREGFTSDRISEMNEKVKSAGKFGGMGGAIGGTTGMLAEYVSSTGAKYVVHGLGLVADVTGAAGLMTAESHGETNFWDNLRCVNPDGSFNFEQATMTAMMIYGHLHGASTVRGKSKAQVFDEITTNNDLQLRYQKGNEGSYEYFNAEALKWEPTTKEFFNERVARDGVKREAHSVKLENRELRLDNDGIWSDVESGRKFRLAKDNNGRTQLAELTKKEIYNSRQKTEVKDGMTLEDFRQELKNNDLRGNVYTKADGGRLVVVKHSFNKYELYEFDTNNKMISQKSVKGKSAIKESYPEFANAESSGTIGSTSGYLGMNNPVGNGNKSKNVETLQDNVNKKELTALRNELGIKQSQKGSRFVGETNGENTIINEMKGNDTVNSYLVSRDVEGKAHMEYKVSYENGKAIDVKIYDADGTIKKLPAETKQAVLDELNKPTETDPASHSEAIAEEPQVTETSTANDKNPVNASENEAIQLKNETNAQAKESNKPTTNKPAVGEESQVKAESRFSESNINFSRTHEGFSQIEGNVKDVPDLRNAESFRNSKDGVGVVYLPKENATAIVVKISGRVNDNYTIMIDGKIPEEQCRALVKSLKDSGNNRFDRQQVADILNKQYEMAETSSVRPETHTEESQVTKTSTANDKKPVIASEGEAIQTKQKPASAEVPKATPEQVAQVMNSLTVFSSDQGARLAFAGKYSTECANIAKKELIYTVDEGKSVKYFPDKDISLIDESAITKEDTGRIGTFRIAVKGRVSEADAKALMEHLFDKGVIKRDADGRLLTKSVLINGNNEKLGEAISEFLANKKLNSQNSIGHSERVSGIGQPVKPTEGEAIQPKIGAESNQPATENSVTKESLKKDIVNIKTRKDLEEYVAKLKEASNKGIISNEECRGLAIRANDSVKANESKQQKNETNATSTESNKPSLNVNDKRIQETMTLEDAKVLAKKYNNVEVVEHENGNYELKVTYKDAEGNIKTTIESEHINGKVVKEIIKETDGIQEDVYNSDGNVVSSTIKDADGNVIRTTESEYQNGKVAKSIVTEYKDGKVVETAAYEYDGGKATKKIQKDAEGKITKIYDFEQNKEFTTPEEIKEYISNKDNNTQTTEKSATEKPAETKTEPKTESNKPAETDPTSHSEAPVEESQAKETSAEKITSESATGNKPEEVAQIHNEEMNNVEPTSTAQVKNLEKYDIMFQSKEGKAFLDEAKKDPNFGKTAEERVPSDKIVKDADGNIQSIEIDGVTYTRNEQGKYVNGDSEIKIYELNEAKTYDGSIIDKEITIDKENNKILKIESDDMTIEYDSNGQPEKVSNLVNTIYLSTGNSSQNFGSVTVDPTGRVIKNEVSIDIEERKYEPYFSEGNRYSDWNKDTNGQAITYELREKTRSDLSKLIKDAQLENRGLRTTKKGRQKAYDDLRNQIEDAYNNNKISREDADNLHAKLNEKAEANGLETQETPTMVAEREALAKWNEEVDTVKDNLMSEIEKVDSQVAHDQMVEKIGEVCKNGKIDMERANELYDALEAKAKSLDGVETLSQKKAKIEKQVREIETAQRIEAAEAKSRHHAELLDEYLAESGENLPSEIGSKEYYDEALSTIDRGVKNGSIEPQKAEVLRTQLKEQLAKLESESNQPVTEPPATEKSVVGEKSQATQNPVIASEGEAIQSPFEITADKFVVNGNEQPIPTFEEAQRTLNKYGGNQYSIETRDGNRLIFRYDDNGKFIGSREEISINGKALKDTSRNADGTLDKTIDYFHTNDGEPVLIERDSNGNPTKIKWWKRNITFDKEGKASYEVTNEKNETINKPIEEVLKDSPELKPLLEKQGIKLVEESNSPVPPVVENKGEGTPVPENSGKETPTSEKSGEGTPAPENSGEGSTPQKTPATAIEDKYPKVPKIEEVETNEGLQLRHKVGDENSYEFFEPEALKWEPTTKEFFEKMTSRDGVKSKATYQNIKNADGSTVQRFIDANGKKVKKIFRNKDGKVTGSNEYVYDVDGKMSKKISKNKDGKVSISTEYKYNEFGKESEVINKDGNGNVIYSEEYKYDKSGNQIEFIHKDENGKIINSTEYKYNEFGEKSEIIHKDENGNPEDSTVFKYDANGKLSLEYEKDSKGEIVSSEEYKYNADGELSKTITRDKDGNITIIYDDEQGHLLSPEETNSYIKKSLENDINNIKTKENVDEYIAELNEALEKKIITEEEYYDLVKQAGEKRKAEEAARIHADEVAEANKGEEQPVTPEPENTPDGFPKAPSKPEQLEKKTLEEILGDEKAPKTADEAKEYAKAHEDAEFVVDKDPNNCNKLFLDKKQNNIVFYNKDGSIQSYREISPSKGVRRRDTVLNPDGTVKSVKTRATNGDLKVEYYEKGNLTQKELYSNENNVWTDHEVYFDSEGNMKGAKKFVQNNETWEQTAEYEYNADNNVFELKKEGKVVSTVKYDEATEHWAEFDAEGNVVHEINKPESVVESESAPVNTETPTPAKPSMFDRLFHRNKVKLEKEVASGEGSIGDYKFNTVKDENGYVRTITNNTGEITGKEYFNVKGKKIKTEEYYSDGKIVTEGNVTTEYNADGTINNIDYPHNKKVKFTYDENGNLIADFCEWHNRFKNYAIKRRTNYKYNSDKGHFELLDENGKVVTDKNGNPVGTATFDPKTRHWVEEGQYSSDLAPKTTNVSRGEGRFRIKLPERNKVPKNLRDENGNLREGVKPFNDGYTETISKEGVEITKAYDSKGTLLLEASKEKATYYNAKGEVIAEEKPIPNGVQRTEFSKDYDLEINMKADKDRTPETAFIRYKSGPEADAPVEFKYNEKSKLFENKSPEGTVLKTVKYDAKNHSWTIKDAKGKKVDSQNNSVEKSHKVRNIVAGTTLAGGAIALIGRGIYELSNKDDDKKTEASKKVVEKPKLKTQPKAEQSSNKVTLGDQEGTIDKDTGTITIGDTEYPKNPDDTYTINGKTYKLEGNKLVEVVDTPDDNGETGGADPDESPEVKGTIGDKEYIIKDGKVSVDGEELTPDENGHYTIGDDKYKIEDGKLVKVEPEESAKTDIDATQSDDSQTGGGNTGDSSSGTTGSQAGGRTDGSTSRTTGSQAGGRTDGSTSRTTGSQTGGRTDGSTSRTTGTTHNDTSRPVTIRPSERREESRVNSARHSAQSEESRANSVRHSAQSEESRVNSVRHSERSEESRLAGNTPVTGVTEPTEAQKQVAKTLQDEISGISTEADALAFFEKLKSAFENGQITTLQSDELLNLVQVHGETLHEVIKIQNEQDAIPEPEFGLGEVPTQQQPQPKAKREITPMERMELTESIRNARDRKDIEKIQKEMRKYKVFPGRKNLRRAYKAKLRAITHDGEQAKKYDGKFKKRMVKIENSNVYKNDKDQINQINREIFQKMNYFDDIIKRPKDFDDGTFNA